MKDKLSCIYSVVSSVLLLLLLALVLPTKTLAVTTKSYYDWGPYYQNQQVLGLTISSLEELPVPSTPPDTAVPQAAGILPGNPLSPFEHLVENIQLTFTFDPVQKEQFRLSLAQERLGEAKALVDQGRYQYAAQAAVSYQETLGVVADNLKSLAASNPDAASQLAAAVEEKVAANAVIAQAVAIAAPPAATATWTYVTSGTEEALDAVSDVQKQPPIPNDLSVSVQSLKDQGLLTPEESEKIYGLGSRAEVRDQLERLATSGRFPIAELAKLDTAVAVRYQDFHNQIENTLQFAELRTYETFPSPTAEVETAIDQWQNRTNKDLPPPPEIRPYLYSLRAEELAGTVDFAPFSTDQKTEIVKFFPEAVDNPSLPSPIPTSQVTPSPAPSPESSAQPEATPSTSPTPAPSPVNPYITEYSGVLPGNPLYFVKKIGEGLQTAVTFGGEQQVQLRMRLAEERLREAAVLAKDEARADDYQQTLEQYRDAMRNVVQAVKTLGGPEDQKQELARTLESEASRHNIIFEKGLLPVPAENTQIFTDAVGVTENLMDVSADTLGRAPLPSALTNRLQDLKAQGLLLSEEVEILTQAQSREAVREKIQDLIDAGTFPPADAKKLDESQAVSSPGEFNQLVEVRKIEELQRLRSVQAEFAQTATLRATKAGYETQSQTLSQNIDPSIIKPEDLAGREELLRVYEEISKNASVRPINSGQFGQEATPGAALSTTPVSLRTLAAGACPVGASFREGEGCVWNDNNRRIDDYEQYRCSGPGQYWSFVIKACVSSADIKSGSPGDASPFCPAGYSWSWESKACAVSRGTLPTPSPEPEPRDDQEREERAKACPEGSTYQVPRGCVWNDTSRSVNDPAQYRCASGQYYSFSQNSCVSNPAPGTPYPEEDVRPSCGGQGEYFSWESGKCVTQPEPYVPSQIADLAVPEPTFVSSDSPFYFLKRGFEAVQGVTAFTTEAREHVRLAQARERFTESYDQLEKNNEDGFKTALAEYTARMQDVYNDLAANPNLSDNAKKTLGDALATQVVEQNLLLQKATVIASAELATPISAAISVTIQGVDRAADLQGEPPIPNNVKEKIAALPDDMIAPDEKQKILDIDSRIEARLKLGDLVGQGILGQADTTAFNAELAQADPAALARITELQKLNQIATLEDQTKQITERVEKTEDVAKKLDEFRQTFEPGQEIPAEIRPYVRLTRIDEVTGTIRPDIIRLDDFGNRKDVQLAIATLQEEFKPTRGSVQQVEQYRRNNPGRALPFDLARVEALYLGLGVRDSATSCFLPSPPFAPNTPCPPPGAAIPVSNYVYGSGDYRVIGDAIVPKTLLTNTTGTDGKPLVYGQGPESTNAGVCPDGYHWMYDSGGWCMSNSGNYSSNTSYSTPSPSGSGYTPYTPYYSAPGAPNYGYQSPEAYSRFISTYSPPNYYGTAPTTYTTNPPPGTVPGSGPAPTASGECPSGFHWMSPSYNQAGWCMADGGTYVPGGTGSSGSVVPPSSCPPTYYWSSAANSCVPAPSYSNTSPGGNYYSPNLTQSSCGPGYYWDGNGCIPTYGGPGTGYSSPSSYQYGCTPGYYWDGSKCVAGSYSGGGWSDEAARSTSWCQPPSGGCGPNTYWDYGSCYCRSSSTYSGGGGSSPSNQCQGLSCGGGAWLDYSTCSCRYSGGSGTSSTGSPITCYPPSAGCPGGWYDYGTCSCKTSSSSGGSSSGSCPSGSHWMSDNGGYCMSDSGGGTSTSTGTTSTSGGGTSSGSCPSGYHWMSDNGGWCMSDGTQTGSTSTSPTTSEPAPAPTSSEPAPAPAPAPPPSEPAPAPAPAPPPSEPAPAPAPSEPVPAP